MQMVDMFYDQLEDAKQRKVPFVIPIGTIEYHALHASCGTDTMVINGVLRELEKTKEIVVCPPIWYGVASYAVSLSLIHIFQINPSGNTGSGAHT